VKYVTENKVARTEGVLKALRTYRTEQSLSVPFPTLSAALFDMDGVLFDSMPAHCRSWGQDAPEGGKVAVMGGKPQQNLMYDNWEERGKAFEGIGGGVVGGGT